MKTRVEMARLFGSALVGLCLQPVIVAVSAQQTVQMSVDSVSAHLRTHPKAKKAPVAPLAAKTSSAASAAKAKRAVPSIIMTSTPVAEPTAKRTDAALLVDSTPAVRRAAKVAKSKPSY